MILFLQGLDAQIQEIKESVELPLTHPEYYEEMGIKPPKASKKSLINSLTQGLCAVN
jgi:SpoVK/Ycf46/Vps4 family AAA+-type ATPase